jgi:hypothetical protein
VAEKCGLELAYALIVFVGAPHTACEEPLGEGDAVFGFAVPRVWELVNDICELCGCASVKDFSEDVHYLVWCGGVFLVSGFTFS